VVQGNYNAHHVAYPQIDWRKFGGKFVEDILGLPLFPYTQIEHYDHFAAFFDALKRINTIIIDLDRYSGRMFHGIFQTKIKGRNWIISDATQSKPD
jgi:adenylosuccinate lyase